VKQTETLNDHLTIQIPFDLAREVVARRKLVRKYETNQVIKALDAWLVLKADAPGSYIQQWTKQKDHLVRICKCSYTVLRHRLQILQEMKLATIQGRNIRLCSWDDMSKIFGIDCKIRSTVHYKIDSNDKIHQWLIATEIEGNQKRQSYAILKQVKKNPELKMMFTAAIIADGADRSRIDDPEYFLARLRSLYLQDFIRASDIHELLVQIRPDNNRGVRGIADAWGAKHPMTAVYWKRKLAAAGIIDISKIQVQSENRVRNKECKVIWLKKQMQTLLCLCDQITVLKPWEIQNLLAA